MKYLLIAITLLVVNQAQAQWGQSYDQDSWKKFAPRPQPTPRQVRCESVPQYDATGRYLGVRTVCQ